MKIWAKCPKHGWTWFTHKFPIGSLLCCKCKREAKYLFVLDVRSLFYRKSYPLFFLIFPADFAKLRSDGSFSPRRW